MGPYKVMLVDDEILVRLGIRSVIEWEKHGFVYIGDASDGIEALEGIERTRPDILLTDIVMPNMNGLDLIHQAKRMDPEMRIIVLSSHNEYEYLRQAMKMGVDDYILKASMKPEELLELLLETANKIAADKRMREGSVLQPPEETDVRHKLTQTLRQWVDSPPSANTSYSREGSMDNSEWTWEAESVLLLMHIHSPPPNSSVDPETYHTLANLAELEMNKWVKGCVIPYNEHSLVLLIPWEVHVSDPAEVIDSVGKDIISALKRFLGISVSIGVSARFAGKTELKRAYDQADKALRQYFFAGKENVYKYEEAMRIECTGSEHLFTNEIEQELRQKIELLDDEGLKQTIGDIFRRMREGQYSSEYYIQVCLELLHYIQTGLKRYDEEGMAEPDSEPPLYKQVIGFQDVWEAEEWFERFIEDQVRRARDILSRTYREEISQLILKMKERYADDWSLKQAAQMANMSESYLSYLFKKATQVGFTAYLNQIRVEKAAEYLRETHMPSYSIAEQIGYDNVNYFSRIFKKIMGVSPQNYRSQVHNNSKESLVPKI